MYLTTPPEPTVAVLGCAPMAKPDTIVSEIPVKKLAKNRARLIYLPFRFVMDMSQARVPGEDTALHLAAKYLRCSRHASRIGHRHALHRRQETPHTTTGKRRRCRPDPTIPAVHRCTKNYSVLFVFCPLLQHRDGGVKDPTGGANRSTLAGSFPRASGASHQFRVAAAPIRLSACPDRPGSSPNRPW